MKKNKKYIPNIIFYSFNYNKFCFLKIPKFTLQWKSVFKLLLFLDSIGKILPFVYCMSKSVFVIVFPSKSGFLDNEEILNFTSKSY